MARVFLSVAAISLVAISISGCSPLQGTQPVIFSGGKPHNAIENIVACESFRSSSKRSAQELLYVTTQWARSRC